MPLPAKCGQVLFRCTCRDSFTHFVCKESLACSMLFDSQLKVPETHSAIHLKDREKGPPGRRARPGKVDKTKKVPFISVISCDGAQHNTCTCEAGVQSSSSFCAGEGSRRKTSSSTRLQPARGQESTAEVRKGLDSIFLQFGFFWEHSEILGTFGKFRN